jgi:hypothetical protein
MNNFNLDHWPIVYFNSNNIMLDDDSFNEYKENYLSLLVKCKKNKEKMLLICNLNNNNNIDNIPIKYIMKQSQFNNEIYKYNKEYLMGVCIICNSKSFKNILNLYFTVSKPAAPYKLCRNIEKANIFIKEKCNINFDLNIFKTNISINQDDKYENENEDDNEKEDNEKNEVNKDNEVNLNIEIIKI